MEKFVYKHTLTYILLFVFGSSFCQKKYDQKTENSDLTLEGKSLKGYKTSFDFGREEVRKGWWKYAREFGSPLNMKSYYKVTIPSETTDGNVDLVIFTQTLDGNGGTDFFLGLENEKYREQGLSMVLDFKKKFYINDLVKQIDHKLDQSYSLSQQYRDEILEDKKQELLDRITSLEQEVEGLKDLIRMIEKG
ncbi:hypothetical protein [Ekhidna sp.]